MGPGGIPLGGGGGGGLWPDQMSGRDADLMRAQATNQLPEGWGSEVTGQGGSFQRQLPWQGTQSGPFGGQFPTWGGGGAVGGGMAQGSGRNSPSAVYGNARDRRDAEDARLIEQRRQREAGATQYPEPIGPQNQPHTQYPQPIGPQNQPPIGGARRYNTQNVLDAPNARQDYGALRSMGLSHGQILAELVRMANR